MEYVRLPLTGAKNVRELGGYPTEDGKVTKFRVFLRGEKLSNLTDKDNEFLKQYGVTDIIDFRGNSKVQDTYISDDNINKDYFNFHYIPLSNIETEDYIKENAIDDSFNFGFGYYLLLKNSEKIKEVFEILAKSEGIVLYHCTAGKDRTGIITALILNLCNVEDRDIIANYEVTYTYIKDEEYMNSYNPYSKLSKAEYMETFLKQLKENYGSAKDYLLSIGLDKENIDKIIKKVVG